MSCLAAGPALAQTANVATEPVLLPTVSVDGSRSGAPGTAATTPTPTTVRLTREAIDAAQVDDVEDVNRLDPAINFSRGSRSFNVRGLDRARVLTTVDGVRVPWIEDGARGLVGGVSGIDFDTISEIDINKGSDSSVFGSGALGGVVAFRTLNPEDLLAGGRSFGGLTKGGYDSQDRSWRVEQALAARFGDTYALFQGGYRAGHEIENQGENGDYGPFGTRKEPRDYDRQNYLAKLRQHLEGGHVFGLTAESYDRDDEIDNRTVAATYTPGSARLDEAEKRQRVSLNYEYAPEEADGLISAADAVVYWTRQQIDSDFRAVRLTNPIGPYNRKTEREEETIGANANAVTSFALGGVTHDIGFGGEIFGSRARQFASGFDNCPPPPYSPFNACNFLHTNQADMPNTDGLTVGFYVEDEIGFLADRLRITPGLRFDWYRQEPKETDGLEDNPTFVTTGLPEESSDHAVSPKLRAEWDWTEGVTVYGQWAKGFRAPTATELYLSYGGPGTYLRIGNPELEPETSNGFEAGLILGDEALGGTVSAFYNRYRNFIDDVSVSAAEVGVPQTTYPFGITRNVNRASVEIYGGEVSAHWQVDPSWRLAASFGGYVGRDRETGVHLNSIPGAKGTLGIGYTAGEWGADAVLTVAAARTKAESEIAETPSYETVDLTAWWQPGRLEGVTVRGGVFNLFDETYYDALDIPDSTTLQKAYFTEPGRTFKASVAYKF